MIKIYSEDEQFAKIPKEDYIFNVETYFEVSIAGLKRTKWLDFILSSIEQATYYDESKFKDRFGGLLYYSELSTGSKCNILAFLSNGSIVNFIEAGRNAYETLLILQPDCSIVLPTVDWLKTIYAVTDIELPNKIDISIVGLGEYHSIKEYMEV